jgi:hypothetical protein
MLWQCNPMFEGHEERKAVAVKNVNSEFDVRKATLAEHMRDCSDNIGRRISVIDTKLEKADDKTKRTLSNLRSKLSKERKRVDMSLKEIEKSTNDSWEKVSKESNNILTEAKIEAQKIEERVEDLVD